MSLSCTEIHGHSISITCCSALSWPTKHYWTTLYPFHFQTRAFLDLGLNIIFVSKIKIVLTLRSLSDLKTFSWTASTATWDVPVHYLSLYRLAPSGAEMAGGTASYETFWRALGKHTVQQKRTCLFFAPCLGSLHLTAFMYFLLYWPFFDKWHFEEGAWLLQKKIATEPLCHRTHHKLLTTQRKWFNCRDGCNASSG